MELAPNYWQLACERLGQRIGYLIQSGQWVDCKFLVGPEPSQVVIEAHKMILATASPVFEAMFFSEMAEQKTPIPIPDIQPATFRKMLRYIYTDHTKITSFDEAFSLYYAAKKYFLPHLEKECIKWINEFLCIEHVCRIYELASLYNEEKIIENCLELFSQNTKEILDDISFEDVQLSTLVKIFSLEEINCTELDLFKAVEKYAKVEAKRMESSSGLDIKLDSPECSASKDIVVVNVEGAMKGPEAETESLKQEKGTTPVRSLVVPKSESKVEPNIRSALEKIRFLTLTVEEFAKGPAESGLLTDSEVSAIFSNIATSCATKVPMPSGFSICREKRSDNNVETLSSCHDHEEFSTTKSIFG